MDKIEDVFHLRLMKRSLGLGFVILLVGGTSMFWTEGAVKASGVATMEDSVWWSFTTLVTGGFGDLHNPETGLGRLLTVVLVIAGMVVVGIFTATLTSVLVGDESEEIELLQRAMEGKLDRMNEHLAMIESKLNELGTKSDD